MPPRPERRLGDRAGQAEVLGAGEDEPSRRRLRVDLTLEVAEQLRDVLHLLEDHAFPVFREEGAGIGAGIGAGVEALQRDLRLLRKGRLAERGLA